MNLVAALSVEAAKPIGALDWYETIIPLIALQLPDQDIGPTMSCTELLTLIMDLPKEARVKILMIKIPDIEEHKNELQEVKQESHRGMLVGISAALMVISIVILGGYMALATVNGQEIDKEAISTFGSFIKELLGIFLSGDK